MMRANAETEWNPETVNLMKKWQRLCCRRKTAHSRAAKSFGCKHKLIMVPIILISTVLGSLSFIDPTLIGEASRDVCVGARLLMHEGEEDGGDGGDEGDEGDGGDEGNYYNSGEPTSAPVWPAIGPTPAPNTEVTEFGGIGVQYYIGALNMIVAILSAITSFLAFNSSQDRHDQYSRLFGNLEVELEVLFAKPASQRGNTSMMVDKYKTRYSMLLSNAPDLSNRMMQMCERDETASSVEIELT
jgi:hypothetical protein